MASAQHDETESSRIQVDSKTSSAGDYGPNRQQHKFYGDIVNALTMAIATPFFALKMITEMYEQDKDPRNETLCNLDALVMVGLTGLSAVFQYLAWTYDSLLCSRIGFFGNCVAGSFMELKEWPMKGVCTITARFQGGVLVLCLANITLSFKEKMIRLILIFVIGSYVSIQSPYSVYIEDTLPNLGGAIFAAMFLIHLFHNGIIMNDNTAACERSEGEAIFRGSKSIWRLHIQREEFIVHSARLVLATIYANHAFRLFTNVFIYNTDDIMDQTIALTEATIIAGVGSVATGVFKKNIDQKEELEVLVRERTKVIRSKTKELRRINVAFEACETAIAITDSSRIVIWTNPAFEELTKRTNKVDLPQVECHHMSATGDNRILGKSGNSIGRQLTDVIILCDSLNQTKLRGAFDFLFPRQDEIKIMTDDRSKDKEKCNYRVEVTPFADSDGLYDEVSERKKDNNNKLFLVAFHDITAEHARKEAENVAREEALVSKAMKESMVTLTHELRTPLQGIMGITSLLLEQNSSRYANQLNKDALESLGLIMASSSLLLNLINNLLDVKKATANMMDDFLLTPLLAMDPIQDAVDFCKPLASISMVDIKMDCNGGTTGAFVNANALRIQQVLINIISNAIKYTARGTTIRVHTNSVAMKDAKEAMRKAISCSKWENDVSSDSLPVLVFSVVDAGPGIDSQEARRLFSRFVRLGQQPTNTLGSSDVGQPSGTGLGLYLCQMFVQRMRGYIWAANNEGGKGSTFSFCLPMITDYNDHHAVSIPAEKNNNFSNVVPFALNSESKMKAKEESSMAPDFRRYRVLVVDDTLINRRVFDRMFKRIGVAHVCIVESGEDALVELFSGGHDQQYDVVITDLQMPGISGTELAERIMQRQALSGRRSIVVIGLTADTTPNVAEICAASGMSDVLYKPITVTDIKDYFQNVIGHLQPGVWQQNETQF
mmetsp:Transcript_1259/g.3206  ORF Transcript_1259/g.3206 Transcript_1259/m.3206 type:complete len:949 (+) Transcript_1259:203-3049(+)